MSNFGGDDPYKELNPAALEQSQPTEDSWFLRGDEPPVLPDEPKKHNYLLRRLVAASSLVGIVGGGTAIGLAVNSGSSEHHPNSHPTALASPPPERIAGLPLDHTTGNASVDSDFQQALARDNCLTPVTFDETVTMYNRLFGPVSLLSLPPKQLGQKADGFAEQITAERSKLGLVPLPSNFDNLIGDALGPNKISVKQYQRSLQSYLNHFDIKTYFHWSNINLETADLSPAIQQLPERSLEHNTIVREVIVRAMQNFANMPPALVKEAGIRRIAFGKILVPTISHQKEVLGDLGETEEGGDYILLDINLLNHANPGLYTANTTILNVDAAHETEHLLDYRTCFHIMGRAINDPAYNYFNKTFHYDTPKSTTEQDRLDSGHEVDGYTTLEAPIKGGKIAVARAYGAANEDEDKATLFGEDVLNAANMGSLYEPRGDTRIIQEKVALLLTRLYKLNPQMAEFYISLLEGTRVQVAAEFQQQALSAKFSKGEITQQQYDTAVRQYAGLTYKLNIALLGNKPPVNTDNN